MFKLFRQNENSVVKVATVNESNKEKVVKEEKNEEAVKCVHCISPTEFLNKK